MNVLDIDTGEPLRPNDYHIDGKTMTLDKRIQYIKVEYPFIDKLNRKQRRDIKFKRGANIF